MTGSTARNQGFKQASQAGGPWGRCSDHTFSVSSTEPSTGMQRRPCTQTVREPQQNSSYTLQHPQRHKPAALFLSPCYSSPVCAWGSAAPPPASPPSMPLAPSSALARPSRALPTAAPAAPRTLSSVPCCPRAARVSQHGGARRRGRSQVYYLPAKGEHTQDCPGRTAALALAGVGPPPPAHSCPQLYFQASRVSATCRIRCNLCCPASLHPSDQAGLRASSALFPCGAPGAADGPPAPARCGAPPSGRSLSSSSSSSSPAQPQSGQLAGERTTMLAAVRSACRRARSRAGRIARADTLALLHISARSSQRADAGSGPVATRPGTATLPRSTSRSMFNHASSTAKSDPSGGREFGRSPTSARQAHPCRACRPCRPCHPCLA